VKVLVGPPSGKSIAQRMLAAPSATGRPPPPPMSVAVQPDGGVPAAEQHGVAVRRALPGDLAAQSPVRPGDRHNPIRHAAQLAA